MSKRIAFWGIYVAVLLAVVEATLAGLYAWRHGGWIYTRDVEAGRVPPELRLPATTFQPYFGYALRRGREGTWRGEGRWVANAFGFQNMVGPGAETCCDYPYPPSGDDYVVGVFGGSVAGGFALQAQSDGSFAKALQGVDRLAGRRIVVLNFAQPGFRQPQQLATLAYFLSIGQHFDLILNIDGFNEIVTSFRNWSEGVEPSFPADDLWGAWGRQLEQQDVPVGERRVHLGHYHDLAARAARRSQDECFTALCFHAALLRARFHAWRADVHRRSLPAGSERRSFFPSGLASRLPKEFDVFDFAADVWVRSSLAMARLAEGAGAEYLHVLQPNQWFREAGDYTPIGDAQGWLAEPVNAGYPRLRGRSAALEAAGVGFLDGSLLFQGVPPRDVYVDDCCHYRPQGYRALFDATARALSDGGPD